MKKTMTWNALWLAGLLSTSAAVQAGGEMEMRFRGTLVEPPPCTINEGNRVDVDFGERVGINKVDGVNYRQGLNYQITCEKHDKTLMLVLSLSGNTAGFDNNALQTSKENLGIRVYQNDKPFTPGSLLVIDPDSPPRLEAVPVRKADSTLKEGPFESWATLRADYQ